MFNIVTYLEKFRKIEPPGDSVKNAAITAVFEAIGVKLGKENLSVSNGVVYLSVPAAVKNEIYMSKREILRKMKGVLNDNVVKDIR